MYDQGLDRGVLYLNGTAVPWNGLVSVEENEAAAVNTDYYFEGNRLYVSCEAGAFEGQISAYTYPDIFAEYNGFGEFEEYKRFGFAYRTEHGADGYRLHLVYDALIRDDARSWKTSSDRPEVSLFTWGFYASAIPVPGASPASHLVVEVPRDESVFQSLEDALYGTETTEPRLPDPAEVINLFESATRLRIVYNGDGTYTAIGPDDMVRLLENGRFELTAPSVYFLEQDIFVVTSY